MGHKFTHMEKSSALVACAPNGFGNDPNVLLEAVETAFPGTPVSYDIVRILLVCIAIQYETPPVTAVSGIVIVFQPAIVVVAADTASRLFGPLLSLYMPT